MQIQDEYSIVLNDGTILTTQGDHLWQDSGIPGMSECECGIVRRYDRNTKDYFYSEDN
jgi:hypothetical protein